MRLAPDLVAMLALTCAPDVAPGTLLAIARVESGLDPYAIGVNGPDRRSLSPPSAAAAVERTRPLLQRGASLDLGLAQLNTKNLAWLEMTVADAFDPCLNLRGAARVLTDGYRRARPEPGAEQRALRTALSYYNTGHPWRGYANGYVSRVAAMAAQFGRPGSNSTLQPRSPPPPAWDVFAQARARGRAPGDLVLQGDLP